MFFKIAKMHLNALNMIYCLFNIAQRILIVFIEEIGNIIKGSLDVYSSV